MPSRPSPELERHRWPSKNASGFFGFWLEEKRMKGSRIHEGKARAGDQRRERREAAF